MKPVFIIPKFAKKEDDVILYLVPRDMFRHGFLCWNGKESTGINAGIAYG